ncbi:MAG: site-specific integrase [Thermoplasmata archaeon]|nr:MAG: site-specific integrase [Thermoplasmata archaeon]
MKGKGETMKNPILRNGVRILRPSEFRLIVDQIKPDYQIMFKTLLLTGMRFVEAKRFQNHPEWFDGDFINLPSSAMLKKKAKMSERSIRLNNLGRTLIPIFLNLQRDLPTRVSWREDLRRWAINVGLEPDGLSAKTTRKTWESWLMFYYPERRLEIVLNQGHTDVTSIKHYLNLAFTNEDKVAMGEYVSGW